MDYLRVGLVLRPHGINGMIKLLPLTDDPNRFKGLKTAFLENEGRYDPVTVKSASIQPDAVFLGFEGVTTRNEAETLRDHYLCVDRESAVKLPDNTYFVADLIGCRVSDTAGADHGVLTEVLETGANDVYVIEGKKTLLVPALKKLLAEVDTVKKTILLDAVVLEEVGSFED
jgi:16S rRNA processing protein RimM